MIDLTTVVVAAVSAMSGTGLTAFFTWWGNHESTGAALEKERLNATRQELGDLRLEVKALRAELHAVEARSRTDRMAAMLSAAHISRLVAQITCAPCGMIRRVRILLRVGGHRPPREHSFSEKFF